MIGDKPSHGASRIEVGINARRATLRRISDLKMIGDVPSHGASRICLLPSPTPRSAAPVFLARLSFFNLRRALRGLSQLEPCLRLLAPIYCFGVVKPDLQCWCRLAVDGARCSRRKKVMVPDAGVPTNVTILCVCCCIAFLLFSIVAFPKFAVIVVVETNQYLVVVLRVLVHDFPACTRLMMQE
jgi:hypothetical protein